MLEALRRHRSTWRLVVGAAAVGLVAAAVAVALTGPWDAGRRAAEREQAAAADAQRERSAAVAGGTGGVAVLDPVDGTGPRYTADGLARALDPALEDGALGEGAAAAVVDLATGEALWTDHAGTGRAPASTVKIVTAVTALDALGPDHRLTTTVRWDAEHERVVLVGGGDPTLTEDALRDLAERTAGALADRDAGTVGVAYDVSLYRNGGERHPIGVNDNIAYITPLQINEGRLDGSTHGPTPRSDEPAADAARAFADALADAGADVAGDPREHTAPDDAEQLAAARSAPLSALVERMLTNSDNDLAEALARHTALAAGEAADAAGLGRAMTAGLDALGIPHDGVRFADASGLDRDGRLTADVLTRTLVAAADPDHPELRSALTGLPVAGFSGTLTDRYADPGDAAGAGVVRAKTGTLTGVNTLAGTAATPDGHVLAFAFLASGTTDADAAEAALDRAASALAGCGCG
ncbi:D-alanyl-D-alanine carboxypeptidase/D-alanyl-D-alanine-endopeptidase [Streptomyces sp. RFCAC02]|uniref:D-alanyl-D-alanine carboxypeptidase/D-alanyl-D-alanine endopeptidase n=1 Tax=Streptomyces sp. RFCAC02 TaxID=2499143 RepID=UPI00101F3F18|nr:D-alanyl-D-alanine carboxypeptidase/D-alanyl-D-alanine-endopeptidase [Streptomyces sp. RFCAC02]